MQSVIVRTKEELKEAKEKRTPEIIVEGELAKDLKKAQKIRTLGPVAIGVLGVGIAGIPITGGISAGLAFSTVAATTGLSISVIIIIIALGLAFLLAFYKNYDLEFELETIPPRVKCRLKKSKS